MKDFTYTIKDELGIHARPAGLLAKEAKKYSSSITITKDDGKSAKVTNILKLMGIAVKKDDTITVTVNGDDEDIAFLHIKCFFENTL